MLALCPACAHENRNGAFFCAQCGSKLHFAAGPCGRLVRMNGPQQDRRIELAGPVCVIGRDPSTSVRLEEESISKQHARLTQNGDSFQIEDLESSNGTFVNGRRIRDRVEIKPGDLLRVGSVILKLEV